MKKLIVIVIMIIPISFLLVWLSGGLEYSVSWPVTNTNSHGFVNGRLYLRCPIDEVLNLWPFGAIYKTRCPGAKPYKFHYTKIFKDYYWHNKYRNSRLGFMSQPGAGE